MSHTSCINKNVRGGDVMEHAPTQAAGPVHSSTPSVLLRCRGGRIRVTVGQPNSKATQHGGACHRHRDERSAAQPRRPRDGTGQRPCLVAAAVAQEKVPEMAALRSTSSAVDGSSARMLLRVPPSTLPSARRLFSFHSTSTTATACTHLSSQLQGPLKLEERTALAAIVMPIGQGYRLWSACRPDIQ